MLVAEPQLIGLYSYIGLHHGSAENYVKLVSLESSVKLAERAAAHGLITASVKLFVDGYCKNLLQGNISFRCILVGILLQIR